MKGLAFIAIGKVGVTDKPIPEPGPNDAVIRTTASLICTSDVHNVRGVIQFAEGRFLGHESVGVVHKIGAGVTRCKVGERVAYCIVRGSYAAFAAVPAWRLVNVPQKMPMPRWVAAQP